MTDQPRPWWSTVVTRSEVFMMLFVIAVVGPIVHGDGAQQASRYVFTAAMWDHHTVSLDAYADLDPPVLFVDRSVRDGHTYSDKAPLQPMLGVPPYAVYRAIGGEPASVARYRENLGLWWVSFWTATVPAAILAMLMLRMGRRLAPRDSLAATIAVFFGSILLPFSAVLFGHVLAALFVFAAFVVVVGGVSPTRLALSGLLAGAAVAAEYTAVIAVVVLAGYVVWRARSRAFWYVLGGIPFAVLLASYHTIAFGSPLAHPYRYSAFNEVTQEARGFLAIFSSLRLDNTLAVFVSWRGFLIASPIVILGLIGIVVLARMRDVDRRALGIVSGAMFLGFLMIPTFWANPWGGASPGPRYMTPAIPFMVLGVVAVWRRFHLWAVAAALLSIVTMGLATVTAPLLGGGWDTGLGRWITIAFDEGFVPTLFTMWIGPLGWLLHIAIAVVVLRVLIGADRRDVADGPLQPAPTVS